MAEASEMSMSMSVQSAWEDLVVENPNRAKLEACLLTTIMLVVCCIIALLVYVFVQLQPQGNIVGRQPFWKTMFFDDPPNRQFALRMLGWINWSETRCADFSRWACGGRAIEASSLAIYETAETAAEDYAAEYALELIDRNLNKHLKAPTEDIGAHAIDTGGFNNMAKFLDKCRQGGLDATNFANEIKKLWESRKNNLNSPDGDVQSEIGFVTEAQGTTHLAYTHAFTKLQFFPLGERYVTKAADTDSKLQGDDSITTIHPPRLIGTVNDGKSKQFEAVVREGVKAIASLKSEQGPAMCCGENGKQIVEIDALIAGWLQDDVKSLDFGSVDSFKLEKGSVDMCEKINASKCRFLDKKVPIQYGKTQFDNKLGSNLINWMWLKFFILLAPLLPMEDPTLAGFFPLVAWYHRRAEVPHRDILCMKIVEHYFRDTLDLVLRKDEYLKNTAETMKAALDKLNGELQAAGAKGVAMNLILAQLHQAKETFSAEFWKQGKYDDAVKKFIKEGMTRTVYFFPTEESQMRIDDKQEISDILEEQIVKLEEERDKGNPGWLGPTFRAEATYDPLKDRIFVPIGLAMPPYFHNDTEKIKHAVPGYLPMLLKPILRRFIQNFLGQAKSLKVKVTRPPQEAVEGMPSKLTEAITGQVLKSVECFKKQHGPLLMWDLYYEKSAVQVSYQVWRVAYNHATQNKDTQLRLGYIKFISEEMIFFITAANALCHTANPKFASKKDQELAPKRVALVLHSKLLGQSMLCDKKRDVFKPACPALFPEMAQQDEALWTVESWRNAKKVILN
ncbi:uncharacterized protein LOC144119413 [Amblyomma americanum]